MPSWNIHTAHAERILSRPQLDELGIQDANAFLFGNYVPDIYVGYMVPDTTYHMDYLLTHMAQMSVLPVPDADLFWDFYIARRTPTTPAGLSLALGAWAHLVADRYYNGTFRGFCAEHDLHPNDDLRIRKQADFDLFGRSLELSLEVDPTPELLQAAEAFVAYRILPADVRRSIAVATHIVRTNTSEPSRFGEYQLLGPHWLEGVFDACDQRVDSWLRAYRRLLLAGEPVGAADIRAAAGFPSARIDRAE